MGGIADELVDPEHRLPGEEDSERSPLLEDAQHWLRVYEELLTFKRTLLRTAEVHEEEAPDAVAADPPHEIRTPGYPQRSEEGGAPRFRGDPGDPPHEIRTPGYPQRSEEGGAPRFRGGPGDAGDDQAQLQVEVDRLEQRLRFWERRAQELQAR